MNLNRLYQAVAASVLLLPLSTASIAQTADGRWDFTPRISVGQIFSDNIGLASSGDEESESISRLDAGFALDREGGRGRARLDYNLVGLVYYDDSDLNDVFQQFDGDARVDLVPGQFFVEADASFDQRTLNRDRPGDILTTNVDRTDVRTIAVTPVYVQRLEDIAVAELRYTYDRVDYSEASETDSERNRVRARLDSGPMFARTGWGLTFDRSEEDFDDGSSVTLESIEALGRLNMTDRFSVFGAVGDEQNEFDQDPRRAQPDDTFWRVGATFEPSARTFMEGFFGNRFFGDTFGATLRHRIRDGQLFADYDETLRTVNELRVTPIRDADGNLIFDGDTGRPIFELPDVRSGVYLSKRFSAGLTIRRPRTRIGLRVYDESREFELTDQGEQARGVVGDVAWRLRPRTQAFLFVRLEENTFEDQRDREDTLFTTRVGVSRDLGPNTSAAIDYTYRELDSTEDDRDYTENRLTATFTRTF